MTCWRVARGLTACDPGGATDVPPPLDLPDLRQRPDSPDCGRVAAEVVWTFLGVKSRPVPTTAIDGTSPDTLEALLWRSGLAVQSGSMDAGDLRHHTGRGRPVICCVTESDGTGHWVVVGGVHRGFVHYQCPLAGPMRERVGAFEGRWKDETRRGVEWRAWGIAAWA